MMEKFIIEVQSHMDKALSAFKSKMLKVSANRVVPEMISHIKVHYHGNNVPITNIATVCVEDSHTLSIKPWDIQALKIIEKALAEEKHNVSIRSEAVYLKLPPANHERRLDLVKKIQEEAEITKIAIRNIRRTQLSSLKNILVENNLGKDEEKQMQTKIQKITDDAIDLTEEHSSKKVKEIMIV